MPLLLLAALLGAGAYFLFFRKDGSRNGVNGQLPPRQTPQAPPPTNLGDVITQDEIEDTVLMLQTSNNTSEILSFAEAIDLANDPESANQLRARVFDLIGFPATFPNRQVMINSLHANQVPLDIQYIIFESLRQRTPESLVRAMFFAGQSGQTQLADIIRVLNAGSLPSGGNGDLTPTEIQQLVDTANTSTDPQFKLWIADLIERYNFGNASAILRSQVIQSILNIQPNSAEAGQMQSILQALPLSLQYLVLLGAQTGTQDSVERAADIVYLYTPTLESAFRQMNTKFIIRQPFPGP